MLFMAKIITYEQVFCQDLKLTLDKEEEEVKYPIRKEKMETEEETLRQEELLEKIIKIGHEAELRGDFDGRTGTREINGRWEFVDPVYKTYKNALQELAIRLGNKVEPPQSK